MTVEKTGERGLKCIAKSPVSSGHVLATGNVKIIREIECPKGSTAVTYTDDTDYLASGQEDGSILLFDKNGKSKTLLDYEMSLLNEPCTDLKIKSSPRGGFNKTILAGYLSGHIKLWDTTIQKVLFTLKENRQIFSLRYHPRSDRFMTVGSDTRIIIYNEETRVTERVLASSGIRGSKTGHTDGICSGVFHPNNEFEIITGGVDDTIQFWDLRAPFAVRSIEGVCMYGDSLDLTQDGKVILCGSSTTWEGCVHAYDYRTGRLLRTHTKLGSFAYTCKFLTPVYVGLGGLYHHLFRLINMKTLQATGQVSGLPACVMSIALCQKVPRYKIYEDFLPILALSAGVKVFEIQPFSEEPYESTDFYYND